MLTPKSTFEGAKQIVRWPWLVRTTSRLVGPVAVCNAPGLPRLEAVYDYPGEVLPECRVRRYEPERMNGNDSSLVWRVDVIYETPPEKSSSRTGDRPTHGGTGRNTPGEQQDPTLELPTANSKVVTREEPLTYVYHTDSGLFLPATNSAGDPFNPPPKGPVKSIILTIERNEPLDTPIQNIQLAYVDSLNADWFWGLQPGVWKCNEISPKRMNRQIQGISVGYLRVTYQFEAKATHDLIILDAGPNYLVPNPAGQGSHFDQSANMNWVASFLEGQFPANPPAPPGNLAPCTFRVRAFLNQQGHPMTRGLNGRGGPLPMPSTFDLTAGFVRVPAPPSNMPSGYTNGLMVVVFCLNGKLPSPLQPNTIYWVRDAQSDGRRFRLAAASQTTLTRFRARCDILLGNNAGRVLTGPAMANGATLSNFIAVGALVIGPGIPQDTVVTGFSGAKGFILSQAPTATYPAASGGVMLTFVTQPPLLNILADGTGNPTIMPLGVYSRLSRNAWKFWAPLNLPQSFAEVQ